MAHMERDTDIDNLKLIVRALHQDVSSLDERLQKLEAEIRDWRERTGDRPNVLVMPRENRIGA